MQKFLTGFTFLILSSGIYAQDVIYHHDLVVNVDPAKQTVAVTDSIQIPENVDLSKLVFSLHEGLSPTSLSPGVSIVEVKSGGHSADKGMDQEDHSSVFKTNNYRIDVTGEQPESLVIKYGGIIHHPVKQINEEYSRGFSRSPGLIDEQGVYLSGSTNWVPSFGDEYITYTLKVSVPTGWRTVSQGARTSQSEDDNYHTDNWEVTTPTEEVFVISAKFTEYQYQVGNVTAMAFLRDKDDSLANKYLETTAQYLEMYRGLVGVYPYSKFALVENFWETGYGMPSFTLLGPQIIRFPFILHSSYPHELLHNWWGNGVFVDFETGNWCEGLTAYMADHLIAEQRGSGASSRLSTLQSYADYVTPENEFPLTEFISRTNASSSAIGYGKTAMMFDMLRENVGDENFKRALQRFYRDNKYQRAGYTEIRKSFEEVTNQDLKPFFDQWVNRSGAPELRIKSASSSNGVVEIELEQIQAGDAYTLSVPVVVYTADKANKQILAMDRKLQKYSLKVDGTALRVDVDPQFNLMRRLHYKETPPALSKMFGASKTLMILPAKASAEAQTRYQQLAKIWKADKGEEFTVKLDTEVSELPTDRSIWILGQNNSWRTAVSSAMESYDAEITETTARFGSESAKLADTSLVVVTRHPADPNLAITWLNAHDSEAVAGLARKLPHYGKYSYLGFTGTEPTNSLKGQWPAVGSPLSADFVDHPGELPALKKRPALAMLAPVFNATRMQADVETLAADAMQGRVPGSAGLDLAAAYIAEEFEKAGLKPGGDNGTYFQSFSIKAENGKQVTVKNVLGLIPGTQEKMQQESVVLSAHYDHLGKGWPDAGSGNKGKIHNGADDNASGVAVMLELARTLGKTMTPERTVVFAAFTAEEAGLLGARHYVKTAKAYPIEKVIGNLNVDTVGRLGENKLLILGSNSAREWKFIFMGASFVTGVQTELPSQNISSSDQVAFIEAGVPGVQFFAGVSPDYHKPGDTADKIDYNGLVKVAAIVREGVEYLGSRPDPMNFQGSKKPAAASSPATTKKPAGGRRASTGIMPDFAFSGKGMAIGAVSDASPAAQAGLIKGDVITAIDAKPVSDLRSYSDLLKQYAPGDQIEMTYSRDSKSQTVKLTLGAR